MAPIACRRATNPGGPRWPRRCGRPHSDAQRPYRVTQMTKIELVEVSPRDGLQNEPHILATGDKVELVRRAVEAGARRVEVASFVHPAKVPQMADAEAVVAGLPRGAARHIGLVLNKREIGRASGGERGGQDGSNPVG